MPDSPDMCISGLVPACIKNREILVWPPQYRFMLPGADRQIVGSLSLCG